MCVRISILVILALIFDSIIIVSVSIRKRTLAQVPSCINSIEVPTDLGASAPKSTESGLQYHKFKCYRITAQHWLLSQTLPFVGGYRSLTPWWKSRGLDRNIHGDLSVVLRQGNPALSAKYCNRRVRCFSHVRTHAISGKFFKSG